MSFAPSVSAEKSLQRIFPLYTGSWKREASKLRKRQQKHWQRPRDYWFKLNKKVKTLARKSALSYKAQENAIIIVEDFTFEAPKTKDFVSMVNNLKIADKKLLLVLPEANKNVYLSARNIERANVAIASALNTYNVLNAETLVVTENSLKAIENILS